MAQIFHFILLYFNARPLVEVPVESIVRAWKQKIWEPKDKALMWSALYKKGNRTACFSWVTVTAYSVLDKKVCVCVRVLHYTEKYFIHRRKGKTTPAYHKSYICLFCVLNIVTVEVLQ